MAIIPHVDACCAYVDGSKSSAALVTLRFTDLALLSRSEKIADASFLTGELAERLLV
jgi:hypothetical protein